MPLYTPVSDTDTALGGPASSSAVGDAEADGVATTASPSDHKHAREGFGTPGSSAVGDAATAGSATTVAHSDHTHGREGFGAPVASAVGDGSANGSATTVAHSDHKHAREGFGTPGSSAVGDAVAAGSATTVAHSDHTHGREGFGSVVALSAFNTASANGSAATVSHSDHNHGLPASYVYDLPTTHGWLDWNFPSKAATSGKILATSGAIYFLAFRPQISGTITNLIVGVSTQGTGLSNSFIGLYSQNGTTATLLSGSADQSTAWGSGGLKTAALGAAQSVTAGTTYLVGIVSTWATTAPTFLGTAAGNSTVFNGGLTAASPFEFGIFSSGLSSLSSPVTMSSITGGNTALPIWVASS